MFKNVVFSDNEALDTIIEVYCDSRTPIIADISFGKGVMWKNSIHTPLLRIDINPKPDKNVTASWEAVPTKKDCCDVVVFDPPHLPAEHASKKSSKLWEDRYGVDNDPARNTSILPILSTPIKESARILKTGGLLIVKIADIQHNHHYIPQHVYVAQYAIEQEFTWAATALKIRNTPGPVSSKWNQQLSLRNVFSYWLVFRYGTSRHERNKGI